jgi:hypothetical protein
MEVDRPPPRDSAAISTGTSGLTARREGEAEKSRHGLTVNDQQGGTSDNAQHSESRDERWKLSVGRKDAIDGANCDSENEADTQRRDQCSESISCHDLSQRLP